MSDPRRKSALAHRPPIATGDGAVSLREVPFNGKLYLRGDPARIAAPVAAAMDAPLPTRVGETATGPAGTIVWHGPDNWLVLTPPGEEAGLQQKLKAALAGIHSQVVDVTDYYTSIELSGRHARELLMKLATLDLHPKAFKAGMGVACLIGRCNPWLRQTREDTAEGGPAFEMTIRLSMADYLWCLLSEAGEEWGLATPVPKGQVRQHLPHFEAWTA